MQGSQPYCVWEGRDVVGAQEAQLERLSSEDGEADSHRPQAW